MSKKTFYWIFGILMVLSLILGICAVTLNTQTADKPLTSWTLITIFAVQPLFYLGLGGISALKLFPGIRKQAPRLLCLLSGLILTLLFIFIAGSELLGTPVTAALLQLLRQVFRVPGYFLLPGILLGLGLSET